MTRLVFLIVAAALVSTVTATHFRGVSLSWRRTAQTATHTTIEFKETIIWRKDACTSMSYFFGDGTSSFPSPSCSNPMIGVDDFTTLGQAEVWRSTFSHTYAGTTGTFLVRTETCCRVSTLDNAADGDLMWTVQVDLAVAQSPQLGSPLAQELRTGCPAVTFRPAGFPADTSSINYVNKIGTTVSGIPTLATCQGSELTLNPTTGSFTWDLSAAVNPKAYAHQVQLVDGTVSSVMDFAIEVTDSGCCGGSCETDSIPADSECDATCAEGTRTGDETCKTGASSASVSSTGKSVSLCFEQTPCAP